MQAVTDEQLIEWVARGDKSCLGTLFERHHAGLYRYCLQLTRDRQRSEDLVQDAFIKVLKAARGYRGEGSFKAWLYRIARHLAFDRLRADKRRGDQGLEADVDREPEEAREPARAAVASERVSLLQQALTGLPAAAREVIWLGRFEFSGYEELAAALGCSAGAARVRMHRAMKQLHALYAAAGGATDD